MRKMSLVLILVFAVYSLQFPVFSQASADTKKAVMIIAHEGFQDDEFARPKEVLEENGVDVTVASTALSPATGMNGMKTTPDILVDNIEVEDFDAIVFVGGSGAMQHLEDPLFHSLFHRVAKDAVASDKLIGAICIAPAILAKAGILQGRNATVHPSGVDYLKECAVSYTGRPVETDGDIITASGPAAAREFGEEIVRALIFIDSQR